MFESLFEDHRALSRHRDSLLSEERRRYLSHCADLGYPQYTLRTIAAHLLVITDYLRLADRPNDLIAPGEIEAQANRWGNRPSRPAHTKQVRGGRYYFIHYATHWLQFLGRWQLHLSVFGFQIPVKNRPCRDASPGGETP